MSPFFAATCTKLHPYNIQQPANVMVAAALRRNLSCCRSTHLSVYTVDVCCCLIKQHVEQTAITCLTGQLQHFADLHEKQGSFSSIELHPFLKKSVLDCAWTDYNLLHIVALA